MYTCTHCKTKYDNQPFVCSNKKKYCSRECIPDSVMDKPYSFQYFNLVENIRDIESIISNLETLEDRIDLENEVNALRTSYTIDVWGDDEGLYYKRQILTLLSTLDKLYDKIHNTFITRQIVLRPATVIYWDCLRSTIGDEISGLVLTTFKEEINRNYKWFYENVYYHIPGYDVGECIDLLCLNSFEDAKEIKKVFLKSLICYKKLLSKEQRENLCIESLCVGIKELCYCVECGHWEKWEDFSINEKLNIYECANC